MRRGEVLALVQAGGQGSRMDVLTRERAKPVLPYGGTHRLIDFVLSSLANSGLVDIWVSVEYQVASIDDYLSGGRPWSLDRNRGGFRRMVPQSGSGPATEDEFAHGNADLLLRMSRDLMHFGAETLVVAPVPTTSSRPTSGRSSSEHVRVRRAPPPRWPPRSPRRAASGQRRHAQADARKGPGDRGPGQAVAARRPARSPTEIFVYRTEALLEALFELRRDLRAEAGAAAGDGDGGADSGLGDFGEHLLPRLVERRRQRPHASAARRATGATSASPGAVPPGVTATCSPAGSTCSTTRTAA